MLLVINSVRLFMYLGVTYHFHSVYEIWESSQGKTGAKVYLLPREPAQSNRHICPTLERTAER
jgi:hypothetical protein